MDYWRFFWAPERNPDDSRAAEMCEKIEKAFEYLKSELKKRKEATLVDVH